MCAGAVVSEASVSEQTAYASIRGAAGRARCFQGPLARRGMLVVIVLHIGGGWALITMQTPKLIIGG